MPVPNPFQIVDLSGGVSDAHPSLIPDNFVEAAWNVEFWEANCGQRRQGSTSVAASLNDMTRALFTHTPTNSIASDQLWRMDDQSFRYYSPAYGLTTPSETGSITWSPDAGVAFASFRGHLHIGCDNNSPTRSHKFDGSTIRRTGLPAASAAPTFGNTGAGSYAATIRYYRVRWTRQVASVTVLRSEPSPSDDFTPSGSGTHARITQPTPPSESETHWEVEGSEDDVNFYRIATVAIGTSTYDDNVAPSAYATTGTLSDDIGEYTLIPSYRLCCIDDDRLVFGGNHETDASFSDADVGWTPVAGTPHFVGNDERFPLTTNTKLSFDPLDGGGLTALVAWEGKVIVFKRSQVHQMVRTSSRARAYVPDNLSRIYGAVKGSVVETTDREGRSCLVFTDYEAGPMMLGPLGLRPLLNAKMRRFWKSTFNASATVPISACPHTPKAQVWWHIATGSANYPDVRWVYHADTEGITFHTMPTYARAAALFQKKPHISQDTADAAATNRIVRADSDGTTDDYGTTFRAYIKTKALNIAGLLKRFNIDAGLMQVSTSNALTIYIRCVRDYGLESSTYRDVLLTAVGSEEFKDVAIDDLQLADCKVVQFEYGDQIARACAPWQVHGLAFLWSLGAPTVGR